MSEAEKTKKISRNGMTMLPAALKSRVSNTIVQTGIIAAGKGYNSTGSSKQRSSLQGKDTIQQDRPNKDHRCRERIQFNRIVQTGIIAAGKRYNSTYQLIASDFHLGDRVTAYYFRSSGVLGLCLGWKGQ